MTWLWLIRNFDVVLALMKITRHAAKTFGKENLGCWEISVQYDDIIEDYFLRFRYPIRMTGSKFYELQRQFNGKVLESVKDKTLYKMVIWTIPT